MDSNMDSHDALASRHRPNPFAAAHARLRSAHDEPEPSRRQAKRRKLQHAPNPVSPWDGFKYGHEGQVVPTRLKMEIVSCDGGEYEKHSAYGLYPIQNVLKNDKSVYCSEQSRCNLLLRHIGEMPFTLEKVVIRAPNRGFTAPVQEGLVFVAMSSDDILSGTSKYKIEYDTPSPRRSSRPSPPSSAADQLLSFHEAIDDQYIEEATLGRMDRLGLHERVLHRRRRQMEDNMRSDRDRWREERQNLASQEDLLAESCEDPDDDALAAAAGVSAPTPPPFTVHAESDDESDENEETPSAAILADRLRRESRWRTESEEEDDDFDYDDPRFPPLRQPYTADIWETNSRLRSERHQDPIRATRRQTASRIEPKDTSNESEPMIAPHANFFIEKHKSKITINFRTAISGKFILLKLWSPSPGGNIDIETVQFYGYSGPRFFPAVQPR